MNRLIFCLLLCIPLIGCSTHESKFDDDVPPPPGTRDVGQRVMAEAATAIAVRYRDTVTELPADALAPLAQSASLVFRTTGAPGMRNLARHYADSLLDARAPVGDGVGFFGAARPGVADSRVTALATAALVDVYRSTQDPRYREAALGGARALLSKDLGWTVTKRGEGVRPTGVRDVDIAATAMALGALDEVERESIAPATRPRVRAALDLLDDAQAGLGRWYARVGSKSAMTLADWAATLAPLAALADERAQGIAGGGVPALWNVAFDEEGRLTDDAVPDPDATGAALSLLAFQAFDGNPAYAELAMGEAIASRRDDGTVSRVSTADAPVQALYANAFARRALDERERDGD